MQDRRAGHASYQDPLVSAATRLTQADSEEPEPAFTPCQGARP